MSYLVYGSAKNTSNREIAISSSVNHKNSRNRSQTRQREPALLITATNDKVSQSSLSRQVNKNAVPIVVSRQEKDYWKQYPSESEFDTTRIDSYLSALNQSRRNRSQMCLRKHNGKDIHMRSRSVDSTLNRLRMSIHKPVNYLLNAITSPSPSGAKSHSSESWQSSNCGKSQSRNVLVTRSESLNSEGSSISLESGICEFNASVSHPAKSVLKKTCPTTSVHIGPGKKNVTFSAIATIQLMDG